MAGVLGETISDPLIRDYIHVLNQMIILRCRRCKGTGMIPNRQYHICQALPSHEVRRYFHIPTDEQAGEDEGMQQDACRNVPETVECPVCEGAGMMVFDEDDWELQVIDEEDTGTGE